MTVCFRCTEKMRRDHHPVVHVDGTARAQLVNKDNNPSFHRILTELKALVGSGVVLNTSFNIHEEPIVRTPEQGVNAFLSAGEFPPPCALLIMASLRPCTPPHARGSIRSLEAAGYNEDRFTP